MGRRRGEDSITSRKRRMPYVAKIKLTAFNAAADAALALGRPLDKVNDTARVLIDWAIERGIGSKERL